MFGALCASCGPGIDEAVEDPDFLVETIPGSRNHAGDGTWWGYNMRKIARIGDRVFMGVVENDDDATTLSTFRIYQKQGDGNWVAGGGFPTSRPGNLVVDPNGALHAFVFEPVDIVANDSFGSLKHYTLAGAADGDIETIEVETVIEQDPAESEAVNIRIGSTVAADGALAVAFGLGDSSIEAWVKPSEGDWVRHVVAEDTGHEFFYPFVLFSDRGLELAPVQDDYDPETGSNFYQIAPLYEAGGIDLSIASMGWASEFLRDLSDHSLAASRLRLLEQSDFQKDSDGSTHLILKEFLDPETSSTVSRFVEYSGSPPSASSGQVLDVDASYSLNWLKRIERDGDVRYLGASWDRLYLFSADFSASLEIPLDEVGDGLDGLYLYVADEGGGSSRDSPFLDVLLLNGNSANYPDAVNAYVRIPVSLLAEL